MEHTHLQMSFRGGRNYIRTVLFLGAILFVILFLVACGGKHEVKPKTTSSYVLTDPVVPKGERLLGIDVNTGHSIDYGSAFSIAKSIGSDFSQLSLAWDDIETLPGVYENSYLHVANGYYPMRETQLALVINPIDTNQLRLPGDIQHLPFDDPTVITRFKHMLDYVFLELEDVSFVTVAIGNEIDLYLTEETYPQYEVFYEEITTYIHINYPNILVGTKATAKGLFDQHQEELARINNHSDVVLVTYYPLLEDFTVQDPTVVNADLTRYTNTITDKPLYFLEIGYPSDPLLSSSVEKQRQFVEEVFRSWDAHRMRIPVINFIWLYDRSEEEVNELSEYYGTDDKRFKAYVRSLGLLTNFGREKSLDVLEVHAEERGW